jgi:hypothetical protein
MVHTVVNVAGFECSECLCFCYSFESEHDTESLIDVRSSVVNTVVCQAAENHVNVSKVDRYGVRSPVGLRCYRDIGRASVAFEQNHWADLDREWRLSFTLAICLIGHYASAFHETMI